MNQQLSLLDDAAILSLTKKGKRELREAGTTLTPALLEALILIDGHANVGQVLKRADKIDPNVMHAKLNELIKRGDVIASSKLTDGYIDPGDFFTAKVSDTDISKLGAQTQTEADANAKFLQQHGYFVNIAFRRANSSRQKDGRNLDVLVIDDDPDICKLLQMCLKLENIDSRTAGNRDEILAALRSTPLPDLVLLDVQLPDANGFDVLVKMRQHPALKDMPVVMLTAAATREAVLKGILGGADGYITKPFEIHPVLRAVKTVLGLKIDKGEEDTLNLHLYA